MTLEKFLKNKQDTEQQLAIDIMNEFIQELASEGHPAPQGLPLPADKAKPGNKWLKKNNEAETLAEKVSPKVQGKWRAKMVEEGRDSHGTEKTESCSRGYQSEQPRSLHSFETTPQKNEANPMRTPGKAVKQDTFIMDSLNQLIDINDTAQSFYKCSAASQKIELTTQTSKGSVQGQEPVFEVFEKEDDWNTERSKENEKGLANEGNKWVAKKKGNTNIIHQTGKQVMAADPFGNPISGTNAPKILKKVAQSIEDPEIAKKAEEFFYNKIGAALLNNFKKNLVECPYCNRNYHSGNRLLTRCRQETYTHLSEDLSLAKEEGLRVDIGCI
jgi:hypothetical protein